jgi:hypothetical protein
MVGEDIVVRLEAAAGLLERTLAWLEERQRLLSGEVEKISATVEMSRREEDLAEKLADAELEIAGLRAAAAAPPIGVAPVGDGFPRLLQPLRRTLPSATADMLAKHGIGEGAVDIRTLDAALAGLSLEQRIAVKSQLRRAGAVG